MRRRNTYCTRQNPIKRQDRFKKNLNPGKILFAEQLDYQMTIQNENSQDYKSSENNSVSSRSSINSETSESREKAKNQNEGQGQQGEQMTQKFKAQGTIDSPGYGGRGGFIENWKDSQAEFTNQIDQKKVVIIGDSSVYEQKKKGFKKGLRRRYSHRGQTDYMTY